MPKKPAPRVATTAKLSVVLRKRIDRAARTLKLSRSKLMEQAVQELCDRLGVK